MTFEDSLNWKEHTKGKGGVINSLNQRFYLIRRLKNSIKHPALLKVAESLFNSKIRYGLQLQGKVRMENNETAKKELHATQLVQNKLIRFLNGKKISDRINTETLIKNIGMLSTNQLNAQIKITESWKAINVKGYPLNSKIAIPKINIEARMSRSIEQRMLKETAKSTGLQSSFIHDAIHIWNKIPEDIKMCNSIYSAKKAIKTFVQTLPL